MGEVAAIKTPISASALKVALTSAWVAKFGDDPPTNAIELLMSQSALETGSWKSCVANNLGNVKSNGTDGEWTFFTTWESMSEAQVAKYVAASTPSAPVRELTPTKAVFSPKHPVCRFRAFCTLAEGAAWYLNFLATHYAAAWPAVLDGDPFAFVAALKAHGYFTADASLYLSGVARMFDEFGTPSLGNMTEIMAAVRSLGYDTIGGFQSATGLVVDNTAGPITRAKLRVYLASQADPPLDAA